MLVTGHAAGQEEEQATPTILSILFHGHGGGAGVMVGPRIRVSARVVSPPSYSRAGFGGFAFCGSCGTFGTELGRVRI